jgi:ATP-binding cassette subfamily F protein 3
MPNQMLVNAKNLSITIGLNQLFEGLSFSVHGGELLAIAGANGTGKSTVLHVISRLAGSSPIKSEFEQPELRGELFVRSGLAIAYLPQTLSMVVEHTEAMEHELPVVRSQVERRRMEFGLVEVDSETDPLSDGQRQKEAIVECLSKESDLYLLDEPTNYLDIVGITAFEKHVDDLKRRGKGVILVTHDRSLTDSLADSTVLLTPHEIYHVPGGMTAVLEIRQEDESSRHRRSGQIRRKIRQLQEDARSKAGWSVQKEKQKRGAKGAKGHISRLSKKMAKRAKTAQRRAEKEMETLEKTKPFVPKKLHLAFPDYQVRNRTVFSLENVDFDFAMTKGPGERLLRDITLSGTTREKICLMGANGAGKTTLLRLIMGDIQPVSGQRYLHKSVRSAYLPQGLTGLFEGETLLDNFRSVDYDEATVRRHLGAVMIRRDKVHQALDCFSYGELMRAAIVRAVLSRAEFMFLDEPTSHLDIESIQVLEQMLNEFRGGFLLISHDRTFVSNVAETLYVLESGTVRLL